MPLRRARSLAFVATSWSLVAGAFAIDGCGSDATPQAPSGEAGVAPDAPGSNGDGSTAADSARPDGGNDGAPAVDSGPSSTGETCIGFAKGTPCGSGGLPDYGYVCFGGSPPGIAGCVLGSSTGSFGDTWCCTENKCVAQPDRDKECTAPGTPHRYQCPPQGDAGNTPPPLGCADGGTGASALERYYCCP